MKFMHTKYGWNAKKSVHFIDVFMGGIFLGHPVFYRIFILYAPSSLYFQL